MPAHKKNNRTLIKVIIGIIVIALIILTIVYFPPVDNVTEVVLYPNE